MNVEMFKALAIKKWPHLEALNNKYGINSMSYSSSEGGWKAEIWIDEHKPNIVHYEYIGTNGRQRDHELISGYFAV